MATITIDKEGQILLPLEVSKQLNLQNNDWYRVCIKSDHIVLIPPRDLDEELIRTIIHEGVLIEAAQ